MLPYGRGKAVKRVDCARLQHFGHSAGGLAGRKYASTLHGPIYRIKFSIVSLLHSTNRFARVEIVKIRVQLTTAR